MLYVFIIISIILTLIFFVYNKYILGLSLETNILQSLLFIFSSIIVAWGVNKLWNPDPIGKLPKPKDKSDKSDVTSPNSDINSELGNIETSGESLYTKSLEKSSAAEQTFKSGYLTAKKDIYTGS